MQRFAEVREGLSKQSFPRSLSDLSDRREPSGRARTVFHDFEAHSGTMQREIGEKWTARPTGAVDQSQVRQAPSGAWMHHHFPCVKRWENARSATRSDVNKSQERLVQRILSASAETQR